MLISSIESSNVCLKVQTSRSWRQGKSFYWSTLAAQPYHMSDPPSPILEKYFYWSTLAGQPSLPALSILQSSNQVGGRERQSKRLGHKERQINRIVSCPQIPGRSPA